MTEIKPSLLGDKIIENGPYVSGQVNTLASIMTMAEHVNALRDELFDLRALYTDVKEALCVQCSHREGMHDDGRCAGDLLHCKCQTWYPMSHAYPLKRRDSSG